VSLLGGITRPQAGALRSLGRPADHFGWFADTPLTSSLGALPAADNLYLYPFDQTDEISVYELFIRVGTAIASSNLKAGIWRNNPLTARPTGVPLVANNAGFDTTSASNIGRSVSVTPGLLPIGRLWAGAKAPAAIPNLTTIGGNTIARGVPMADLSTLASNVSAGSVSTPDLFTNDIGLTDLTNAVFTVGGFSQIPIIGGRWR
jgi:hypothetical protein